MARGAWQVEARKRAAFFRAETADRDGIAIVLEGTQPPIDGRPRRVVAYSALDVPAEEFVAALRELADRIEEG